ncbi:hypothetical protein [Agathobaculum massiliense]|uniref:hypothetical protein n=1 Tax=Agathobaculum massiliense TaxID=3014267 RepID=UPI000D1D7AB4|nr:hypothetical protein [Agathobaculum massiliense]
MKLKRFFSLALGAALALSTVAYASNDTPVADNNKPGAVQPPSNYVDCNTLEEAIEMTGIEISIPEVIKGYDDCAFRANKTDGMIEIIFQSDDDEIRFRKGLGDEDISGNYNDFSEKSDVNVDGSTVQMKGSDGKVNLATWSADGYSYSIDSTEAMDKTVMTDFIKAVNNDDNTPIGGDPATWGPGNQPIGGDPATWGPDNQPSDNGVQPPSPFQPCDTLDAAEEMAGFDLTLPKTADKLEAIENEMIQAFYGEDGTDMLIRKALGNEDISGDYNEYAQTETVDGVTLKGTDGQFSLALWTNGEYTYSISVGSALSQTDMMVLVGSVK